MILLRPAAERGHADHGWLKTWHSFSFADYYDPDHMGFRTLRVINEDIIAPGGGFPTHGHRNMEILTYIIAGTLEHKDNCGGQGVIRRGEIQRMTAGSGIRHSEYNGSAVEPVHLLQIWIETDATGHEPGYEQATFDDAARTGQWLTLASAPGQGGLVQLNQDIRVAATLLAAQEEREYRLLPGRHAWVQIVSGQVRLNGRTELAPSDGAAISDETVVHLEAGAQEGAELLLFDLN